MNRFAFVLESGGDVRETDAKAACQAGHPGGFVWVHLDGREGETLDWLKEHGNLPETVAYALTAIETRPRCEPIGKGALINLRGPAAPGHDAGGAGGAVDSGDLADRLVSIRAWTEAGRAITVSFHSIDGLHELIERMKDGEIKDPGDLISMLAIEITRRIDPVVTDLGDTVDDCELSLEPSQAFETRRKIAAARSEAIVFRRFVAPQREALLRLARLEVDWLEDGDRLHLNEAADRFARMTEELEAVRERSALIHEQLTDLRSELIEHRALWLSIVALVFLPLTFITGLLGMNVDGIPGAHYPWAFDAVCGLCVVLGVAITVWFAAARWFRG